MKYFILVLILGLGAVGFQYRERIQEINLSDLRSTLKQGELKFPGSRSAKIKTHNDIIDDMAREINIIVKSVDHTKPNKRRDFKNSDHLKTKIKIWKSRFDELIADSEGDTKNVLILSKKYNIKLFMSVVNTGDRITEFVVKSLDALKLESSLQVYSLSSDARKMEKYLDALEEGYKSKLLQSYIADAKKMQWSGGMDSAIQNWKEHLKKEYMTHMKQQMLEAKQNCDVISEIAWVLSKYSGRYEFKNGQMVFRSRHEHQNFIGEFAIAKAKFNRVLR